MTNEADKNPSWKKEFVALLKTTLQTHQTRNPKYSARSFSKRLGLSNGSLSDLLNETPKGYLSPSRAAEVLGKLEAPNSAKNKLLLQMNEPPKHEWAELPPANYDILLDWMYLPVLASFDLPIPNREATLIANRLGAPLTKIKIIIDDLVSRQLLITNKDGILERPEVFLKTTDNIPDQVILKHHENGLELAARALREMPTERRDFTALTFIGSEKKLARLKEEIRNLYKKSSTLLDDESNDQIFRLSIQLFPVEFSKK